MVVLGRKEEIQDLAISFYHPSGKYFLIFISPFVFYGLTPFMKDVPVLFELLPLASGYYDSQILSTLTAVLLNISQADPGRNLTSSQQKDSGRCYMSVEPIPEL